jgi:hypothetical protein
VVRGAEVRGRIRGGEEEQKCKVGAEALIRSSVGKQNQNW